LKQKIGHFHVAEGIFINGLCKGSVPESTIISQALMIQHVLTAIIREFFRKTVRKLNNFGAGVGYLQLKQTIIVEA
jgi:hypothetical protein